MSPTTLEVILSLSLLAALAIPVSAVTAQPRDLSFLLVCGEIASAVSPASEVFYLCQWRVNVTRHTAVVDLHDQWNLTIQKIMTTGHSLALKFPLVQWSPVQPRTSPPS